MHVRTSCRHTCSALTHAGVCRTLERLPLLRLTLERLALLHPVHDHFAASGCFCTPAMNVVRRGLLGAADAEAIA